MPVIIPTTVILYIRSMILTECEIREPVTINLTSKRSACIVYRIIVVVPSIMIPSRSFGWIVTEGRISVVAAGVLRWVVAWVRQFILDGCCSSRTHCSDTSSGPVVERVPQVDGRWHESTLEHLTGWTLREWSCLPPVRVRSRHSHRNSPSVYVAVQRVILLIWQSVVWRPSACRRQLDHEWHNRMNDQTEA